MSLHQRNFLFPCDRWDEKRLQEEWSSKARADANVRPFVHSFVDLEADDDGKAADPENGVQQEPSLTSLFRTTTQWFGRFAFSFVKKAVQPCQNRHLRC
mmetsp:Transcript_90002/g.160223  ORF Transcript_90002/g.160223 Transcript_90002/m.160223 type:complete len:99 (+) Transcript_90002:574-870(+)